MIKWKLREIMFFNKITGEALAKELEVRPETITRWKNSEKLPGLDGDKVDRLTSALTKLSGKRVTYFDLLEDVSANSVNFSQPVSA